MSTFTMGIIIFVLLGLLYVAEGRKVFVAAPNTLRLDAEETVVITVAGGAAEREVYNLYLQDYPARKNKFSVQDVVVHHGISNIVNVKVTPKDLPVKKDGDKKERSYVYLVVTGNGVSKEIKLPVSPQSGHFFIQTDKPIYTPQQTVKVRIISVSEQLLPKDGKFRLQIRNPQNIVVDEKDFEHQWNNADPLFPVYIYDFPPRPVLGEWSVVVFHGHEFQLNSTVHFQVDEYVLPNFVVSLEVPNVILPGTEDVEVHATATYVYGKKVEGTALFRLGVKHKLGNIIELGRSRTKILEDGSASLSFSTNEITNNAKIGAFPLESKLFVEVDVVDTATGLREKAVNEECSFASSPYIISFERSQRDFKPGLVSVVMADVTYTNGKPAQGVPTSISVVDDTGKLIKVTNPMYKSDDDGHVFYTVNTPIGSSAYTIKIKTNDRRYGENQQFIGTHVLRQFKASGGYVAISRLEGTRVLEIDSLFSATVVSQPAEEIHDVFYLVLSRGRIVLRGSLSKDRLLQRELQFQVTAAMAPSIRIVVFGLHRDELVADAIRVEVENKCERQAEVKIAMQFKDAVPGGEGIFSLSGQPETIVGILAVDSAVYALRDKDRLTRGKLFKTLKKDDLGCGPGGGLNTELVLANAGVVVFGNFKYIAKENNGCAERLRRKREIVDSMVKEHDIDSRKCCQLAFVPDKYERSCEERAEIVRNFTQESDDGNCTTAFLSCCESIFDDKRGREFGNENEVLLFEFVKDLEAEESQASVRKDFRETWLFQDLLIGPDGKERVSTNLPHSITTWIVQAVSVSHHLGMCVSEPQELVSFKKIFIHLNLPYSVVQNEQIEIQATIFNYFSEKVPVIVYMYGVEDLCTGVEAKEKSERKRVIVDAHSTITVGFPVVPLKVKEYTIRFVALSQAGHDVIEKKLRVVPKGVPFEETFPIVLDPTNQKRRKERNVITESVTDSIDASEQLQLTAVKLRPTRDFVAGTESCVITAVGDEFGPTVETAVHNPETLVKLPVGCGEQTMMFMGPTVYTLNYLKVKGRVTPALEGQAYGFVREGYNRELTFRKDDGSYAAWIGRASSTWLTAFVMKVFCQARKYVYIDPNVICSGLRWLVGQQNADGSFTEKHQVIHWDMMGGVKGAVPMTAFVLIALQHCTCETEKALQSSKVRALLYLEDALPHANDQYVLALMSYALALSDSKVKNVANEKLKNLATYNEGLNQRHWSKGSRTHIIETTAYALLAQVTLNDMQYSIPIVNWLNSQRLAGGSFPSTQDTVIALHALSEYQMRAQSPGINLHCNVTQSNDKAFLKTLHFQNDNVDVLQQFELEKVGGTVFFRTSGSGVGSLSVTLRYNVPRPAEKLCKFNVTVDVKEAKPDVQPAKVNPNAGKDLFVGIPDGLVRALEFDEGAEFQDYDQNNIVPNGTDQHVKDREENEDDKDRSRVARDADEEDAVDDDDDDDERGRAAARKQKKNSKITLEVNICARYLSDKPTDMAIIDAGIFSGFKPDMDDLKKLIENKNADSFELAGRGVIFYLRDIPSAKSVCLKFRIRREFIVSAIQRSVIKVYDYYNTDEACTIFYSPDSNSALLQTICEGSVCQCAEGGCPNLKQPFGEFEKPHQIRAAVLFEACEKHDYVWKGEVESSETKDGFVHVVFRIDEVLKPGAESRIHIEGLTRTLLLQETCPSFEVVKNQEYLIMGKDGERFEDRDTKELQYRYLIDKTTVVYKWMELREAPDIRLQKALNWLETELRTEDGCKS